MIENEIAKIIVDAALKIHRTLGPGLLESVYEATLAHELRARGLSVTQQLGVPVTYDGMRIGLGFRADLVVGHKVLVEIKSVELIAPVHRKQLQTYLRLMGLHLGLLINFNVELIKDGIQRRKSFARVSRRTLEGQFRKSERFPQRRKDVKNYFARKFPVGFSPA